METSIVQQALSPAPPPETSNRVVSNFGKEVDQLLAATVAASVGLGTRIDVKA